MLQHFADYSISHRQLGAAGRGCQQAEALELPGANTAWLLTGEPSTQLQVTT